MFPPTRHVVLEFIEARIRLFPQLHNLFENLLVAFRQRLQLPVVVVNDSHRAGKSVMEHVSISEYADMRIRSATNKEEFNSIIQDLLMIRNYFSSKNIIGDLATTYLRLGRVYSRYATVEEGSRTSLLQKAADFYKFAEKNAIKFVLTIENPHAEKNEYLVKHTIRDSGTDKNFSNTGPVCKEIADFIIETRAK